MRKSIVSKNNNQFVFGAILSYAAIAFNIISGLLYTPWMIRIIGDDQYALYTLALSIINLFLIDFGIGTAVSRFLSSYYAEKRYDDANQFMGIVYKVFFIISAVILLCLTIFYFLLDGIYVKLTPDELFVFKRLFIIVSVYSVVSFPFTTFNSILMANERFVDVKACELISKILCVVLIVVCLYCNLGVYSLVIVHALVNFISIGVKYLLIRRNTRQRSKLNSWNRSVAKNLFGFTAWVTVKDIAHRCIFTIMPTVIAALIGSKEITLFTLAATLEGYVYTFADAVNGMFMPRISKLIRRDNANEEITSLMTRVGNFHVFTIGLIFCGFICVGDCFVNVWMGEGYTMVYYSALLLILPSLIETPQQVAKTTLLAKGIVKEQSIVYIIMAVTNLALAIIFLNIWGILGASLAVCIAYLLRTFGMNVLYKKYLSINLKKYFFNVYGKWVFVALITVAIEFTFSHFIILPTEILSLLVKGILVVVVYCVSYVLICVEKKKLKSIIYGILKR